MLPGARVSPARALSEIFYFWQKRGNNSDIKIFGLSLFCEPITHIDINICQKFQCNPLSRKKVIWKRDEKVWWKSVTDRHRTKKKVIPKCLPCYAGDTKRAITCSKCRIELSNLIIYIGVIVGKRCINFQYNASSKYRDMDSKCSSTQNFNQNF